MARWLRAQNLPPQPKADVIFLNGNIYTGVRTRLRFTPSSARKPWRCAMDGLQAVGRDDEIVKLKGPATEVDRPGWALCDARIQRCPCASGQRGFSAADRGPVGSEVADRFRERIRGTCSKTPGPDEWIVGGGWDQTLWPVKELPSRWDIDEVTHDHPVFLERVDGHIAVANTRALQLASITVASKDPPGGKIDRDSTGQATGILRETARQAVTAVIPKPNHDRRRQAIEAGLQELAEWASPPRRTIPIPETRRFHGTISRSSKKSNGRAS